MTDQKSIDSASENSLISRWNMGTTGSTLLRAMNSHRAGGGSHTFSLRTNSTATEVVKKLQAGLPVVALIRTAGTEIAKIAGVSYKIPALHWIALNGFDSARQLIHFTETDGGPRQMTYSDFNRAFNWNMGWAANTFLSGLGVVKGTFIA